MNRIEAKMKALQEKGEKAFITYITAGSGGHKETFKSAGESRT